MLIAMRIPTATRCLVQSLFLLTLLTVFSCCMEVSAADLQGTNFIFILDASGSMAAQIQGKAKMEVAKDVLVGLVKDLPATAQVGLVAYGHREKGDCNDIEELVPLSPINKEVLQSRIGGLKPKGMTPLTGAVQMVAEGLKGKGQPATIILVSDGEETCKGDPCAAVRELKASGAAFMLHVIGFDVKEKERRQLHCIAEAGGGYYFAAKNAGELKVAAQKAVEIATPKPVALEVHAVMGGQPVKAHVTLNRSTEQNGQPGEMVQDGLLEKGRNSYTLTPGTYDLQVENLDDPKKSVIRFQDISLAPGESVLKVAEFAGGTLVVKALRNGKPTNASCTISQLSPHEGKEKERITSAGIDESGKEFKLVPGTYEVEVIDTVSADKSSEIFKPVAIEQGKSVEKVAAFNTGSLYMKAIRNNKPIQASYLLYRPSDDEEKEKEKVTDGTIDPAGGAVLLKQGQYDLVVVNQEDEGKPTVSFPELAVVADKTVEKIADFSGGSIKITAVRNGSPFSAAVYIETAANEAGAKKSRLVYDYTGSKGKMWKLPPGTYDVTVINKEDAGSPKLSFPDIKMEMGASVEKVADFSGGGIKVTAIRNGKPLSAVVFIDKATEEKGKNKDRVVNDHSGVEGKSWKLAPGTYDLTVINKEDAGSPKLTFSGIQVEAGSTVDKVADFTGGSLKVNALRNGKPFSASLIVETIPSAETGMKKERVVNDYTGVEGKTWKLAPGAYDIIVSNRQDAGSLPVTFPATVVEAGANLGKTAEFAGGSLKVTALVQGKPTSLSIIVERKPTSNEGKKERLINDYTGNEGKAFFLAPGSYDVTITNSKDQKRPTKVFEIQIEGNGLVEKEIDF